MQFLRQLRAAYHCKNHHKQKLANFVDFLFIFQKVNCAETKSNDYNEWNSNKLEIYNKLRHFIEILQKTTLNFPKKKRRTQISDEYTQE